MSWAEVRKFSFLPFPVIIFSFICLSSPSSLTIHLYTFSPMLYMNSLRGFYYYHSLHFTDGIVVAVKPSEKHKMTRESITRKKVTYCAKLQYQIDFVACIIIITKWGSNIHKFLRIFFIRNALLPSIYFMYISVFIIYISAIKVNPVSFIIAYLLDFIVKLLWDLWRSGPRFTLELMSTTTWAHTP